jgi:hypothetical protein
MHVAKKRIIHRHVGFLVSTHVTYDEWAASQGKVPTRGLCRSFATNCDRRQMPGPGLKVPCIHTVQPPTQRGGRRPGYSWTIKARQIPIEDSIRKETRSNRPIRFRRIRRPCYLVGLVGSPANVVRRYARHGQIQVSRHLQTCGPCTSPAGGFLLHSMCKTRRSTDRPCTEDTSASPRRRQHCEKLECQEGGTPSAPLAYRAG